MVFESKKFNVRLDNRVNRIYLKPMGFWSDENIAADYSRKIREAVELAKKDFTVLIDLSKFKIPKQEVLEVIKKTQLFLSVNGMSKAAEIVAENPFTEIVVDQLKKEKHLEFNLRKKFTLQEDAEEWLSSPD